MTEETRSCGLPEGCERLFCPLVRDARGSLVFAELRERMPFDVARVFWIFDVPDGVSRGGHAHRTCHEVVFAVSGSFTLTVDDGCCRERIVMSDPSSGLLLSAGVWCELTDFAKGTVVVVFASEPYDASGYINTYADFLAEKGGRG